MLKKRLVDFLRQNDESVKFQVIRDPAAAKLIGGEQCAYLSQCGTFSGKCDTTLTTCGMFTEP